MWMPQKTFDHQSNIILGNELVWSGSKSLAEPMLAQICHHMASLGHNELTHWGWDRIAVIVNLFSNGFLWMKIHEFQLVCSTGSNKKYSSIFHMMGWCRPGDKPLSETIMVKHMSHPASTS